MEGKILRNISSSPHVRSAHTTGSVMGDVFVALVPATVVGIWHYGLKAALIVVMSILSCCLTEFVFDYIAQKENTVKDLSAAVTGLLLALVLPPAVPLYIPLIGGIFAILFVKCFFGGLGKNFMNPALAARCFLLISFGTLMTNYSSDAVSGPTPLAVMAESGKFTLSGVYTGSDAGVIGSCVVALIIGGIYLLIKGIITWQIPASMIGAFAVMELILGQCANWQELLFQIFAGGIILGAFFMATDPVSSPMTEKGQLIYGGFIGIMCSLFRVYGSAADSVSYAIIFGNCVTPLIDLLPVDAPMGVGIEGNQKDAGQKKGIKLPMPAVTLCIITLIAGIGLGSVNLVTRDRIAEQQAAATAASYLAVLPDATAMQANEALTAAVEGADYGKSIINEVWEAVDASGSVVGYAVSVTNKEAFDGSLTVSVGIATDGTVTGIAFTEINETAGMGLNADKDEWKAQFAGKNVDAFKVVKGGGASADNEINSVSGATITSNSVVNAVNAALQFIADNAQ